MSKSELTSKSTQAQPKKRAWVTPAFEQVPLKEALNGFTSNYNPSDTSTFSS